MFTLLKDLTNIITRWKHTMIFGISDAQVFYLINDFDQRRGLCNELTTTMVYRRISIPATTLISSYKVKLIDCFSLYKKSICNRKQICTFQINDEKDRAAGLLFMIILQGLYSLANDCPWMSDDMSLGLRSASTKLNELMWLYLTNNMHAVGPKSARQEFIILAREP